MSDIHPFESDPQAPTFAAYPNFKFSKVLQQRMLQGVRRNVYLSEDDLQSLGINCSKLDLQTGLSFSASPGTSSDVQSLVQPWSLAKIEGQMQKCGFGGKWKYQALNLAVEPTEKGTQTEGGHELARILELHLEGADAKLNGLIDGSAWDFHRWAEATWMRLGYTMELTRMDPMTRKQREHKDREWYPKFALVPKDGKSPHITCFLTERSFLRDDCLLQSEIWTILGMTISQICHGPRKDHKILPVTIITGSGSKFRIVQAMSTVPPRRSLLVRVRSRISGRTTTLWRSQVIVGRMSCCY
ncbi:hypothetical protein F5Y16DRAFT_374983 [Xylariaceae sp. FL0255]|nr:hypothetical protein F5Y16DRAFT_374983 [Xylariaceae sp. FL0255]